MPWASGRARCAVLAGALLASGGAAATEDIAVETQRRGAAVEIAARATLRAPLALVWQTLTDYDRLSAFIPGMHRSRVLERRGPTAIVEQVGEARILFFSFPIEVTLASLERPPYAIEVRMLKGNLKRLSGGYRIEPAPAGARGALLLRWEGVIEPATPLPPLLGEAIMRANIEDQFVGMVREIERRDAARRQAEGEEAEAKGVTR